MSIITSEAHFRQRVLKYSLKYGVTAASIRYKRSRQAIYEWRARWDGKSWHSLVEKSHRPHHHPNEHTPEKKRILRRYPRYKDDMMLLWNSLRKSGYTRSYTSLVQMGSTRDTKAYSKEKQALHKSRISWTKGTDRRKVCALILRRKRSKILPVYCR